MKDIVQSRTASALTMLAGAWLMVTPLFISMDGVALTSVIVSGGVMAAAGLVQLFWFNVVPSWVTALAAIWLFISAFALSMSNNAAWNQVIAAIVIFALASWDGVEASEVQHARHQHLHIG
jgi:hypothetical protein